MDIQCEQKLSELCMLVVQSYFCGLRSESIVQPGCGLVKTYIPAVCGFEFLRCV
jgi:hypothetical protein